MSFLERSRSALDYAPWHYENSRVPFRGPKPELDGEHIAFLGGCETYGRFVRDPFVRQLGERLNRGCANLGRPGAGIDLYLNEPAMQEVAASARTTVIQVLGAQNLTNRFYKVHPRRNDRFVKAGRILRTVYREVDFTEFHFNRHLLGHLRELSEDRFAIVVDELRTAWLARMKTLCARIGGDVRLLWIGREAPPGGARLPDLTPVGPLFVSAEMLEELRPLVGGILVVTPEKAAGDDALKSMVFDPHERAAAAEMLPPVAHDEIATRLADWLGEAQGKGPAAQATGP